MQKWLKYSKWDTKCTRKSILGCNGDCVPWEKFEAKRWSHRWLEFELPRLLLETMILLWDAPDSKERSSKLVPNFTKKIPWGFESTPRWHTDFCDFRTPSTFPVIKIPTRPTPVAASRIRNVWKIFQLLGQWMKTCKATHTWFCRPYLPMPTCSCGWDLIYTHKMHGKCKNSLNIANETRNAWEN
jgi:hypothetical protein